MLFITLLSKPLYLSIHSLTWPSAKVAHYAINKPHHFPLSAFIIVPLIHIFTNFFFLKLSRSDVTYIHIPHRIRNGIQRYWIANDKVQKSISSLSGASSDEIIENLIPFSVQLQINEEHFRLRIRRTRWSIYCISCSVDNFTLQRLPWLEDNVADFKGYTDKSQRYTEAKNGFSSLRKTGLIA